MNKYDLMLFVASELSELETRDVDQLFECIKDNLEEMRAQFDETELYNEIERQIEADKRAELYATKGVINE